MRLTPARFFGFWATLFALVFTLSSCTDDLDVQQSYPFTVEVMPYAEKIVKGQTVELRFEIKPEGNYTDPCVEDRVRIYPPPCRQTHVVVWRVLHVRQHHCRDSIAQADSVADKVLPCLESPILLNYLADRGIPRDIAQRYCVQVDYTLHGFRSERHKVVVQILVLRIE